MNKWENTTFMGRSFDLHLTQLQEKVPDRFTCAQIRSKDTRNPSLAWGAHYTPDRESRVNEIWERINA
jgi:hypothetical protein